MYNNTLFCLVNLLSISIFAMNSLENISKKISTESLNSINNCLEHWQEGESEENPNNGDQQVYQLCYNPYQFYAEIQKARKDLTNFPFDPNLLFLKLCPCIKMNSELRAGLENSAIDLLKRSYSTDTLLTIVSVGPGGCYQELVYLTKLVQAGYKELIMVLVDPADVMLGALSCFCDEHLATCKIKILKYHSLNGYINTVKDIDILKPDLLLLIDLTDDKFKIDNKSLLDYSFNLFQENQIFKPATIIAYSILEIGVNQLIPKAICCSYDENSDDLSSINLNKKEIYSRQKIVAKN